MNILYTIVSGTLFSDIPYPSLVTDKDLQVEADKVEELMYKLKLARVKAKGEHELCSVRLPPLIAIQPNRQSRPVSQCMCLLVLETFRIVTFLYCTNDTNLLPHFFGHVFVRYNSNNGVLLPGIQV
jgi:hypothetical protein